MVKQPSRREREDVMAMMYDMTRQYQSERQMSVAEIATQKRRARITLPFRGKRGFRVS